MAYQTNNLRVLSSIHFYASSCKTYFYLPFPHNSLNMLFYCAEADKRILYTRTKSPGMLCFVIFFPFTALPFSFLIHFIWVQMQKLTTKKHDDHHHHHHNFFVAFNLFKIVLLEVKASFRYVATCRVYECMCWSAFWK